MSTPKKCSHGIDLLPHAECLDCDLLWHQSRVDEHARAMERHLSEVDRILKRIDARQQQERAEGDA